ncbi:Pyruvate/2-oxoglutarate dehydrogenase complex, dihydrolipoamide dehydrogenase (E3) component [Abditibacterium utsteinense]|uniref:Pyruvate/2-oxoglutarate dehydrogenase complex, dihydrolipoamide dehydrogenase (E3) component n=1 Tax=Abditibacterium utsteinense TaxID=1960156 RepID=A0A2S8SQ99_9BACT|nr:NAD(P)/FAD-dependent oxidoreductase [Abditibacterium utsteinense]PQV62971.1 Pyruvate/2-oxoglutarate dehydrogenase complex, dihydrolipoamide dehydrogenase (E3) component [Abditibacterium utsteinense]
MKFDYDLAVIGAGTGGLVSAFVADSLGARVALIEADKVGGECLWRGCVPSKTLVKSAKVFDLVKRCEEFGIHVEKPRLIWNAVKLRLADVRDEIRRGEREQLAKTQIEQISGKARFIDAHHLEIESKGEVRQISAKKFIIATGSRAVIPEIEGLEDAGFITHDGLFQRPNLPKSLIFIGGGPISVEMAQAFSRFGTKVTILQKDARLLPKEEPEISDLILQLLRNEGVTVHLGAKVGFVEAGDSQKTVHFVIDKLPYAAKAGEIVVAVGKTPNFASLNLEAAGVNASEKGIKVDEKLRTSAKNIWACGDVTGKYLFTHAAEYEAKIAAQNAILPLPAKTDFRALPWVTFTDPEIAHLGMTREEAEHERGAGGIKVWKTPFKTLDRAIIEGETTGFLQVVTTQSGVILGVHIIGPSAGELIASFIPAVREGALLQEFAEAIFPYPTLAEIGHRAGNEVYQELLESKTVQTALKWLPK